MADLYTVFENELNQLKQDNQYRFLKIIHSRNNKFVIYNNKKYLNLSSNDYLGLATDKECINNFYAQLNDHNMIDSFGPGSTSSRLLSGNYELYSDLESLLSDLYNKTIQPEDSNKNNKLKEALVFNSGYHANIGIISTLTDKNSLILSDSLNHASIIDGTRLSRAHCIPYEHFNYDQIDSILKKNREKYNKAIIISESVFSMDGDIADIKKLVEIKNRYNALLYIDEAHAVGLFGDSGLGICEREDSVKDVDIIIGTFGKAFASQGAYAITNQVLKEYLINNTRTLLYTTALPPVIVNWNIYILKKLHGLKVKRDKLQSVAERLRISLTDKNIKTAGASQIVPAITGNKAKTIQISDDLQLKGFLVFPIRPPTVPQGTSRIRISLTANIDWEDIESIPDILSE
ncbi:MAG: 8-amino-7-oxononanoate synthase [Spirochaetes bacterium]|nr:8-amino-7-oxononanoate synthase [Spirochaetota bacterium]